MNTHNRFEKLEKAQALPLIVGMVIAVIGFAALMIDGGAVMLNRRTAQAAADAGAMAGARELCYSTGASPVDVAVNYALMNGAADASAVVNNGVVTVNTTVMNDSFFAGIFNEDTLAAGAEAAAGCYPPAGNHLMPIAWSCRPSLGETGPFDPGLDCMMMGLDWVSLLKPLVEGPTSLEIQIPGNIGFFRRNGTNIVNTSTGKPPSQIYIIMDKIPTSQENYCKEDLNPSDPAYANALTCDVDGDGKNDIISGGHRGWLSLDGSTGTSAARNWIRYGTSFTVAPHTWFSPIDGNITPLYKDINDFQRGKVVWIPVFNAICNDKSPKTNAACMQDAHANPKPPEPPGGDIDQGGNQTPKFHVITFNPFYISCVREKSSDVCPGFTQVQAVNPDKKVIPDNLPIVEGFFLTNVDKQLDLSTGCNVNMGNCIVSLIK